ncbi:hypothetical protein LIER_25519 [Lithospermum erythrorhizon]|uniref:Uncharacterized protein n=1 Tax=Lithospermum erythrorhizon TaxID=34254 RepID=A0AAV3R761_LITER
MGDLSFTPHHDPFANMAISHEVAENIARTLNDALEEESLPFIELSVQPLAALVIRKSPKRTLHRPLFLQPPPLILPLGRAHHTLEHPLLTQVISHPLFLPSSAIPYLFPFP